MRRFNEPRKIWRVSGKRLDNDVRQFAAASVPGSLLQLVGRELEVCGKHVLPFRRERRIENRWNRDIKDRRGGNLAILRGVEGLLQIIDFVPDVNAAGKRYAEAVRRDRIRKRSKVRQITERKMHFGDAAGNAEVLDAHGENGIEIRRVEQLEEGALRIDTGNNGFAGDLFAVCEDDTGNGAILGGDVSYFGVGANLDAGFLGGFAEGAREFAKPAARECRRANRMRIRGGAEQQERGGARGPGAEVCAEDSAGGNRGAQKFGVEEFGDEIGHGHRAPAQEIEDASLAEAANGAAGRQRIPEIFRRRVIDGRRSDGSDVAEDFGHFLESCRKFGVARALFYRKMRKSCDGFGGGVVKEQAAATGRRSKDGRLRLDDGETELVGLKVASNVRAERAEGVRKRRGFEAGMKFLRDH